MLNIVAKRWLSAIDNGEKKGKVKGRKGEEVKRRKGEKMANAFKGERVKR